MDLRQSPPTLVLAPLDQGVRNVGGRPGASEGPSALVNALERQRGLPPSVEVHEVPIENRPETLEEDLDALTTTVRSVVENGRTPIVIGGDHGTTYASVRGVAKAHDGLGVCYLDVHFDLRPFEPNHTSGSSFRRLIEEGIVAPERVAPIGIQSPDPGETDSTTSKLAEYADRKGVAWVPLDRARREGPGQLARQRMQEGPWYASLDVDALSEDQAPGVSAPGPDRFSLQEAQGFLDAALDRAVAVDLVEFAPRLDVDGRTLSTLLTLLGRVLDRARRD